MSKSNAFETAYLGLVFNNTNIANIGDATGLRGSSAAGSFFLSLHTADPGEAGDASTSETAYTGYARQAVARSGAGFVITGNSVSPAADVNFPECTASPGAAITHFGVTTVVSGASLLLYKGALTPTIAIAVGASPRVKAATAITED
jgi:hypothetical protein